MRFLQKRKLEKEQMHPLRWKMIHVGLPLYVLLSVGLFMGAVLIDVFLLGAVDEPGVLTYVGIAWFVLCTVLTLVFSSKITKLEVRDELQKLAYLFEEPTPLESETLVEKLDDIGVVYTLDKNGVRIEWEAEEGGQVFDEVQENHISFEWHEVDLCLATQTIFRRAQLALAIVPRTNPVAFILPMNENVYRAMHTFNLMEKTAEDWAYLHYNPQDAFRQIILHGRVLTMHNKETGKKIVDENELNTTK